MALQANSNAHGVIFLIGSSVALLVLLQLLGTASVANAFTSPSSFFTKRNTHIGINPALMSSRRAGGGISSDRSQRRQRSMDMVLDGGVTDAISEAWSAYNDALEADPLIVKSVTACIILGAADLAGQALERAQKEGEKGQDEGIDYGRFIRFAIFGLVLQAPWNHFYYLLLDGALPPTEDPWTATTGIKVFIDQFVQAPIFTVLIFVFLGLLEGKNTDAVKKQLENDYADTMVANWKLWVPATVINIAFCPPPLRVLFLNVVFFFWSIFLSLKLNKEEETA